MFYYYNRLEIFVLKVANLSLKKLIIFSSKSDVGVRTNKWLKWIFVSAMCLYKNNYVLFDIEATYRNYN